MFSQVRGELSAQLDEIRSQGLFKSERVIVTPQQATVGVSGGGTSSISARTTTSASPMTLVSSRQPNRHSTAGATAWRACVSSAAPRRSTRTSSDGSPAFWGPRIPSFTRRASTR